VFPALAIRHQAKRNEFSEEAVTERIVRGILDVNAGEIRDGAWCRMDVPPEVVEAADASGFSGIAAGDGEFPGDRWTLVRGLADRAPRSKCSWRR
jgi:hypothetical protein